MKILMVTNTYTPMVGGLENSLSNFCRELADRRHEVLILCPSYDNQPEYEENVIRVESLNNVNGTPFSLPLIVGPKKLKQIEAFAPDLVHAHHPFLLGDFALKYAVQHKLPIVLTYHTLYEHYTHNLPVDSDLTKKLLINISSGYANLCDAVIAPSASLEKILRERQVTTDIYRIPTGIYINNFQQGRRQDFCRENNIPEDAFIVGTVSRISQEKNIHFLMDCMVDYLKKNEKAYAVIVGDGPAMGKVRSKIDACDFQDRFCLPGVLKGKKLWDAYVAMDVFAFASHSETQGLVLVEAMAADTPVVAVQAPGASDIVSHEENGYLIEKDEVNAFCDCLVKIHAATGEKRKTLKAGARQTAEEYSMVRSTEKLLALYCDLLAHQREGFSDDVMERLKRIFRIQEDLAKNFTKAVQKAVKESITKKGDHNEKNNIFHFNNFSLGLFK